MPRFAANLTMLFTELPMLERFAAAAAAGFMAFVLGFDKRELGAIGRFLREGLATARLLALLSSPDVVSEAAAEPDA